MRKRIRVVIRPSIFSASSSGLSRGSQNNLFGDPRVKPEDDVENGCQYFSFFRRCVIGQDLHRVGFANRSGSVESFLSPSPYSSPQGRGRGIRRIKEALREKGAGQIFCCNVLVHRRRSNAPLLLRNEPLVSSRPSDPTRKRGEGHPCTLGHLNCPEHGVYSLPRLRGRGGVGAYANTNTRQNFRQARRVSCKSGETIGPRVFARGIGALSSRINIRDGLRHCRGCWTQNNKTSLIGGHCAI